jgi:hypothetical protein
MIQTKMYVFGGSKHGVCEIFDSRKEIWTKFARPTFANLEPSAIEPIDTSTRLGDCIYLTGQTYLGIVRYTMETNEFYELGILKTPMYKFLATINKRLTMFTDDYIYTINLETLKGKSIPGPGFQKRMAGKPMVLDNQMYYVARQGVMYIYDYTE